MPSRQRITGTARLAQSLGRRRDMLRRRQAAIAARPLLYAAVLFVMGAVVLAIAWPFTHAHLQSIAVLDLVANKPVPALLREAVAEPVTATEMTLPLATGTIRARMYTPDHKPNAPALVVLHGVHHLGMDEPRLIAFASAMASCGIRVLTPELPNIKDYHIGADSIATIGEAATWLAEDTKQPSVGILGLSFSGSLSLLAAANPAYRDHIKFVLAIGSEDEMSRVADFYRTGEDPRPTGAPEMLPPHEYGALVLEYDHLEDFAPKFDLAPLRAVLRSHLYEDPAAETAALAKLSPRQTAEAKQLMDTSSPYTRSLLAKAETRHVQDMAGISPHGHLAELTTPVYLLHGQGDNIIPSAETMWMANELPSETLKASLISPVISHLDLDGPGPSAMDQWRLVHFFALILHAAEAR